MAAKPDLTTPESPEEDEPVPEPYALLALPVPPARYDVTAGFCVGEDAGLLLEDWAAFCAQEGDDEGEEEVVDFGAGLGLLAVGLGLDAVWPTLLGLSLP